MILPILSTGIAVGKEIGCVVLQLNQNKQQNTMEIAIFCIVLF